MALNRTTRRSEILRLGAGFLLRAAAGAAFPGAAWVAIPFFGLFGLAVTAVPSLVAFTLLVSLVQLAIGYLLWQGEQHDVAPQLYMLRLWPPMPFALLQLLATLTLAFCMARAPGRLTKLNMLVFGISVLAFMGSAFTLVQ